MTTVRLTPGFLFRPSNPDGFPGMTAGLRIAAGTAVLTEPPGEPASDPRDRYDARGEPVDGPADQFYGDYLHFNVDNLQEAILPFLNCTADRHREHVANLRGESMTTQVVFSHLDGRRVRIALKPRHDEHAEYVRTESMLGAAIDPEEFARQLIACRRQMIEYVERAYGDWEPDLSEEIADFREREEERIEEIEALIE